MEPSNAHIEELKRYCGKVGMFPEAGFTYYFLGDLRLPAGCEPPVCDALLCPQLKDGYPSRLYFSVQVNGRYARNWNFNARIGEKNWLAFSWKVDLANPTLAQLLVAHLSGFVKEK